MELIAFEYKLNLETYHVACKSPAKSTWPSKTVKIITLYQFPPLFCFLEALSAFALQIILCDYCHIKKSHHSFYSHFHSASSWLFPETLAIHLSCGLCHATVSGESLPRIHISSVPMPVCANNSKIFLILHNKN